MIDILKKAAYAAGKIQRQYFQKKLPISYKSSKQDLLTKADLESQKIIQEIIVSEMVKNGFKKNEIGFIGEEKLMIKGKHLFIIDPIDGTTNFALGIDLFGISIAHFIDGKAGEGLIYLPVKNELYFAIKGKGAFENKKRLKIEYKKLDECLLSTYISKMEKQREQGLNYIRNIFPHIRALRIYGSIIVHSTMLVKNKIQADLDFNLGIWDIAAAKILMEEAGASVVNIQGKPLLFDFNNPDKFYQSISCHPKLLPDLLKYIKNE